MWIIILHNRVLEQLTLSTNDDLMIYEMHLNNICHMF